MTIQEALDLIDGIKPNMVPQDIKVRWLSELDGMLDREIVKQHHDGPRRPYHHHEPWLIHPLLHEDVHVHDHERPEPPEEFQPYDPHGDLTEQTLLVQFPYDKVYQHYLAMQIDVANQEIDKYNNDSQLYQLALQEWSDWYTRTHFPKQRNCEFHL